MPTQNGNSRVYTISTDFPGLTEATPHPSTLNAAISALSLSVNWLDTNMEAGDDKLTVITSAPPSTGDQTALDGVVTAHTGVHKPTARVASYSLRGGSYSVVSLTMDFFAAITEDVAEFGGDPAKMAWTVRGEVKVSGNDFEMRMVDSNGTSLMSANHGHADTSGAWEAFSFSTDVGLSGGLETYRVEAKISATTTAELRGLMVTLMA